MSDTNTVKDRLKTFLKSKNIGQGKFEASCGLSNGYVNNIRVSIQPDKLQKIALRYPDLNTAWLILGDGEMLKEPVNPDTMAEVMLVKRDLEDRGILKPNGSPYYNVDFIGGFDLMTNDQTTKPDYYIDFSPYNEEGTIWCNITGHSMEPEINNGDMIALKEVSEWSSFLLYGEIYAIVTNDGMRTVKRVGKGSSNDSFKLIPANKNGEYDIQEISKSMIMKVFKVMGCVKRF